MAVVISLFRFKT